ncbi:glycosyltransferase [Brachybacterium endophyticum]|uniref:glycosyltransferase n=1 Tax=Brachybacterium endophyticum TaxID=2182385 RepID=UPI001F0B82E3|nr:glycosyltransferase [Brachybacterium endophyticum]
MDPSAHEHEDVRVVAVVVTYNRAELLQDCLDALAAQSRPVDAVVVIDNASTDASGEVADRHPLRADVLHLHLNVGGAGGFASGIARALVDHRADWVWLMDDDTIPRPGALEALLTVERESPLRLSVLSSRAEWIDGRAHPMNLSRTRVGASAREKRAAARSGGHPIRTASYVSVLLRGEDVRRLGLPHPDYFIWSDDFEHTGRLLRRGRGLHVPGSVVEHRTKVFANAQASPGDRFYYDVRNRLWALTRTRSFALWERAMYGGATVRGWARQLVRHPELAPIGLRGLRDALRGGPRPSAEVLAADPEAAEAVGRIDGAAGR